MSLHLPGECLIVLSSPPNSCRFLSHEMALTLIIECNYSILKVKNGFSPTRVAAFPWEGIADSL